MMSLTKTANALAQQQTSGLLQPPTKSNLTISLRSMPSPTTPTTLLTSSRSPPATEYALNSCSTSSGFVHSLNATIANEQGVKRPSSTWQSQVELVRNAPLAAAGHR